MHFLGDHRGSLQPSCAPGHPKKPQPSKSIPYTLGLSDLKKTISSVGEDGDAYGEHSGKRGGATYAAQLGMDEEEIQDMGNWKDVRTARLYIEKNTPLRMKRNQKLQKFL